MASRRPPEPGDSLPPLAPRFVAAASDRISSRAGKFSSDLPPPFAGTHSGFFLVSVFATHDASPGREAVPDPRGSSVPA